ncbi:MAG: multiprotein-bridging factor 1 family protein [Nanoarchaeota archaeon]
MANCELCGKTSEKLFTSLIESVSMSVCDNCKNFGTLIQEKSFTNQRRTFSQAYDDTGEYVDDRYNLLIKNKREQLKLTQEELSIKLQEKISLISKIERADIRPTIELAKKFENLLGIRLISKRGIAEKQVPNEKYTGSLTIGDLLKKK